MTKSTRKAVITALVFLPVLFAVYTAGCERTRKVAFSDFRSVSQEGWHRLNGADFNVFPDDSVTAGRLFDLVMYVRFTGDYEYQDLLLDLQRIDAAGAEHHDTLRLSIADERGALKGKNSYGLHEISDTIAKSLRLTEGMAISVNHAMNDSVIKGINNIGLVLTKHTEP